MPFPSVQPVCCGMIEWAMARDQHAGIILALPLIM